MTFHIYGDNALLINFVQKIDTTTNTQVIALQTALKKSAIQGLTFFIPAYCSLTVGYNPQIIRYQELCEKIKKLALYPLTSTKGSIHQIPVCYELPYALDLEEVSQQTGLSFKNIIQLHTTTIFQVYMLGFLPGFAYLGSLPTALKVARKASPRKQVPALSVGLAGLQTGIYPSKAPGGWQIIGRSPIKVFNEQKADPFLLKTGDKVQFYAISKEVYAQGTFL